MIRAYIFIYVNMGRLVVSVIVCFKNRFVFFEISAFLPNETLNYLKFKPKIIIF